MDVGQNYISNINHKSVMPFRRDYPGAVQLVESSGFSPFKSKSPVESTLDEIFSRVADQDSVDQDSVSLKSEFLELNPGVSNSMNPYTALENAFYSPSDTELSPVESFINSKIENNDDKEAFMSGFRELEKMLNYFSVPVGSFMDVKA